VFLLILESNAKAITPREAHSPFEVETESFPRHADPVQNVLMSPINPFSPDNTTPQKPNQKKADFKNQEYVPPYQIRVMIDAGHGGKDVGAGSRQGLYEKKVTLNLARKVKRELERTSKLNGYAIQARLTRDEDVFIPLKQRARLANEWGADVFVSIHLNSSPVVKARGFEVYFLSPEASDPEAERLALRESEGALPTEKEDVLSILSDVQTTFHTSESALFAEDMFSSISKQVLSNGRGVRQGPFTVLHGTKMPSILVEVGYLTNPQESQLLSKEAYLKRLASAISSGIIEYGSRTRKLG